VEFEEYVAVRGPALLRFAFLLSRDAHTAEDLVQSALADAYRHWRKVERADHPDAYVKRIVLNRYLGWRRRLWSGETPTAAPPDARTFPDPADEVVARDAMRRMLDGLPPRTRAVLVLRYYEDLDDHAIADLLGIAPSTVRSTAARALSALRAPHTVTAPDSPREEQP
jgi:RNA polymerase sigma-70 factor (sigma-E family)